MNDLARFIYLGNFYYNFELSALFYSWLSEMEFSQMSDMIHDPLAGIC